MPFKDVREFIARLEKEGEAQRIEEEVDWNLEAGAMLHRAYEHGLPAPFFQKLKGYPQGYRIFGGTIGNYKRAAIAMDLDPATSPQQLIEEYLKRSKSIIKPVLVKSGPCKENIHVGGEVDLLEFPVPKIIPDDGGRFIGTWNLAIAKDPDTDWVNWGTHRVQVHDRNTTGLLIHNYTHIGTLYRTKYEPRNKVMEIVIAITTEPISSWFGGIPVPYGVSEVDVAGGIRGAPVELVKCETVDLAVPATTEIVIEGEMRPNERMNEGPFGEYTGYVASLVEPRPVIHVRAITHRNNPILSLAAPGMPVYEGQITSAITRAAEMLEALRKRGIPISGVSVPVEGACLLAVVAVKTLYSNIAEQVANVVWSSVAGQITPYLIVVDNDVDPFNMAEVVHALVSKCHPYRGVIQRKETMGSPLWPFLDAHERRYKLGSRAYFDCTWPLDWDPADVPARVSFREVYPAEVQQKALAVWQKYGY